MAKSNVPKYSLFSSRCGRSNKNETKNFEMYDKHCIKGTTRLSRLLKLLLEILKERIL